LFPALSSVFRKRRTNCQKRAGAACFALYAYAPGRFSETKKQKLNKSTTAVPPALALVYPSVFRKHEPTTNDGGAARSGLGLSKHFPKTNS